MKEQVKIIVTVGFGCKFEDVYGAIQWIHEQDDYKDKSAKYVISCGSEIDVD